MENIQTYKQLPLPEDSAWDRFTVKRYLPIWFNRFTESFSNIFRWLPVIWKDKHWDGNYIFEILKKKLEFQREHLVKANRHEGIGEINKYITICLNLIEKVQNGFYELEHTGYRESEITSTPCAHDDNLFEIDIVVKSERYQEYIDKNKLMYRKAVIYLEANKQRYCIPTTDLGLVCSTIANLKQEKAQTLLFKILDNKINHWWD